MKYIFLWLFLILTQSQSYADTTDTKAKAQTQKATAKLPESKNTIDIVQTVAGIATALAFILALLALVLQHRDNIKKDVKEKAEKQRTNLLSIQSKFHTLTNLLTKGEILFFTSSEIAKEYVLKINPTDTDKIDLSRFKNNDEIRGQIELNAAVCGWNKTPLVSALNDHVIDLSQSSLQLIGFQNVLTELIKLLEKIIADSYSTYRFGEIFKHIDPDKLALQCEEDKNQFISLLTVELQSAACGYFYIKYYESVNDINKLAMTLLSKISSLADEKLINPDLSPSVGETHTDLIQNFINENEELFSKEELEEMKELIAKIKFSISKEAAIQKLNNRGLTLSLSNNDSTNKQ